MITVTINGGGGNRERASQQFEVAPEQTLLQGAEAAPGGAIPVGCRGGGCGRCKVRVLQGHYRCKTMSRAHISEVEAAEGYVLACRTFALSNLKVERVNPSLAHTVE